MATYVRVPVGMRKGLHAPEEALWNRLEDGVVMLAGRQNLSDFHSWLRSSESALGYRFNLESRHSAFLEYYGANPKVMRFYRKLYGVDTRYISGVPSP